MWVGVFAIWGIALHLQHSSYSDDNFIAFYCIFGFYALWVVGYKIFKPQTALFKVPVVDIVDSNQLNVYEKFLSNDIYRTAANEYFDQMISPNKDVNLISWSIEFHRLNEIMRSLPEEKKLEPSDHTKNLELYKKTMEEFPNVDY